MIRGATRDYSTENPPASAVALVVEVADASLVRDRVLKAVIYARARIPTYWIVDLAAGEIEVLTRPTQAEGRATYSSRTVMRRGERIPVMLDGREVGSLDVTSVLP